MTRPIKIFIIGSVVLNLLMAGVILGHAGGHFFYSRETSSAAETARALPADKQKLYEDALRRAEENTAELREQLSGARKQAAILLKTEPFDRKAYLAQLQHMNELRGQITYEMGASVANLAQKFTPVERAILADAFRKSVSPWHSHKYCDDKKIDETH